MEIPRIIYGNYERTSSGMVYIGQTEVQKRTDRINKIKSFLLCLIQDELELSFRSQHCLNEAGIKLIGQLVQKSASELLGLKNLGRTSLRDMEEALRDKGLTLDMPLNFFPWNENKKGAELIKILSLQQPGGGFFIDHQSARALGINLKELNQTSSRKQQSLLHTKYLLGLMASEFERDAPYLTILFNQHHQWLGKESK